MIRDKPTTLSRLDWLLVWLALTLTGSLIAMPLTVAPMFAGLVGSGDPPLLTRLALAPWFPPLLALPPAAMLIAARRTMRRRLVIATAAAVALAAMLVCLTGLSSSTVGRTRNHVADAPGEDPMPRR